MRLREGELQESKRILDQILLADSDHSEALILRGQIYREQGQLHSAEELWNQVPQSNRTQSGIAKFLLATLAFEQRELKRGEQLLEESKLLNPEYIPTRERLARLHILLLRATAARRELEELRRIRAWTVSDLAQYRMAYGIIDNPESVIPLLRAYLRKDPDHNDCRIALLRYLIAADRREEALELMDPSTRDPVLNARMLALQANIHTERGELHLAAGLLRTATDVSSSIDLRRSAGLLANAQSNWDKVLECLTPVCNIDTEDSEAAYVLALSLNRLGREQEATEILAKADALRGAFTDAERLLTVEEVQIELATPIVEEIVRRLSHLEFYREAVFWYELLLDWNPNRRELRAEIQRLTMLSEAQKAQAEQVPVSVSSLPSVDLTPLWNRANETAPLKSDAVTAGIQLVDEHELVGLDFQYFNGQSDEKYLLESLGGAVAVLDLDRDGWPDLYFPQGCRIPVPTIQAELTNAAFRNRAGSSYQRVEIEAGLDGRGYGQGCASADYDNDGFPDLALGTYGQPKLLHNNGDGTFSEISGFAGAQRNHWTASLAWGDINNDGYSDLYLVNYLLEAEKVCRDNNGVARTCNPENYPAEPDVLLLNEGDGTFRDITIEAGITAPLGRGIGAIIADLDADGRMDIYVGNDGTPNHLYHNRSEGQEIRFEEVGLISGSALRRDGAAQASMGIAYADFNGDERLDLYVTHFYGDYNTLYRNEGSMLFSDVTSEYRISAPTHAMLAWGAQAIDFDLDGWEDLFVANGHIDDLTQEAVPWKMPVQVFLNREGQYMEDISATCGEFFRSVQLGRGVARLDWNRDGMMDVVVVSQDRPVALLTNRTKAAGNGIAVELTGVAANRDAIGARVVLQLADRRLVREITGSGGFFAANDYRQLIGIGSSESVQEVTVIWPDGSRQVVNDVPAHHTLKIIQNKITIVSEMPEQ